MEEVVLDIKKWGNSLGMRLPVSIAKAAHLHLDQKVSLTIDHGRVIISPVQNKFSSLEDRLARFKRKHTGELMVTDTTLGAEKW
jgi:antitoxin MazE